MMLPIDTVLKQMNQNEFAPLYLLHGTEYYFIDQFKKTMSKVLQLEEEASAYFDLRETAIQDVILDVQTLPLFTERNVIFAEYPTFLATTRERSFVEHDLKVLENYIQNPAPYSILVLIAPYEKLDGRKKITKLLKDKTSTIDCNPIKGQKLRRWLQSIIKSYHITMTEEAILRLEAEFGSNLFILQREIEKIAHYVGKHKEVQLTDLYEIMSSSIEQSAINLSEAILNRNLVEAMDIYRQLEALNEEPIGMIALTAYQFRMMLQVRLFKDQGYSLQQIQRQIQAHPYVVKKAFERVKYYDKEKLTYIINELAELDFNIKQGRIDPSIGMQLLLYRLIHVDPPAAHSMT